FDGLNRIGSLRGASAGVLCRKRSGIFSIWKVIDEKRDICPADASSIFGPQFYRGVISDHIFPAVSGDMVVDAQLQRLQQSGFSVVSASDDQSNALRNSHSGDRSAVRRGQSYLIRLRGN